MQRKHSFSLAASRGIAENSLGGSRGWALRWALLPWLALSWPYNSVLLFAKHNASSSSLTRQAPSLLSPVLIYTTTHQQSPRYSHYRVFVTRSVTRGQLRLVPCLPHVYTKHHTPLFRLVAFPFSLASGPFQQEQWGTSLPPGTFQPWYLTPTPLQELAQGR